MDQVALVAFDLYMSCRQKVYEIRASEVRDRSKAVLRRFGLLDGDPGQDDAPENAVEISRRSE